MLLIFGICFLKCNLDDGKKLHFVSPARRKSVLAPILNKIKNGADAADSAEKKLGSESSGSGHIAVQIEPARRVKVCWRASIIILNY